MHVTETNPEFNALQYTFLSQIGHREDFRQRLANLYEEWRGHFAQRLTDDHAERKTTRAVPPRAMASLIQAILHGLAMQLAADPDAFDRKEMAELCLDVVGRYLGSGPYAARQHRKKTTRSTPPANGSRTGERRPRRPQGVQHE
jgi:hypothetical protein